MGQSDRFIHHGVGGKAVEEHKLGGSGGEYRLHRRLEASQLL